MSASMVSVANIGMLIILKVWCDRRLQLPDERIVHIAVAIRDMKTNDSFTDQRLMELGTQPILVAFFHDKDHVGPAKMACSDANTSTLLGSCRADEMPVNPVEYALGGQTPPTILAANEEQLHRTLA